MGFHFRFQDNRHNRKHQRELNWKETCCVWSIALKCINHNVTTTSCEPCWDDVRHDVLHLSAETGAVVQRDVWCRLGEERRSDVRAKEGGGREGEDNRGWEELEELYGRQERGKGMKEQREKFGGREKVKKKGGRRVTENTKYWNTKLPTVSVWSFLHSFGQRFEMTRDLFHFSFDV